MNRRALGKTLIAGLGLLFGIKANGSAGKTDYLSSCVLCQGKMDWRSWNKLGIFGRGRVTALVCLNPVCTQSAENLKKMEEQYYQSERKAMWGGDSE